MTNMIQYPHTAFIGCRTCRVLQPVVHQSGMLSDDAAYAAIEAYNEFVDLHASHSATRLRRRGGATSSNGPLWDPLATLYFEVADEHGTYVVTATRDSIDEPRVYRFAPGILEPVTPTITVEDTDLRRGLDLELFPYAIRPSKVESFVDVLHEVVSQIEADAIEIAFDDAADPAVSIARMPDESYEQLLERCAAIFDDWELPRVSSFLAANRDEDGLLALRVRQEYRILAA